jgi:hypothetical protein
VSYSIAEVVEWKFGYIEGVDTIDEVIVKFPKNIPGVNYTEKGIPFQKDQDAWADEYSAWKARQNNTSLIKSELEKLDSCSIRAIREFLIARFGKDPDLPKSLINYENIAILKRQQL